MNDVTARLRALALDVATQHGTGPGLPVAQLVSRARARRTRRTVWTAGAAAVVVVATALGAGALGRHVRDPLPADTPTGTASPTPSPSPTATVLLPPGDAALPFGECGSLVGSPTTFPADGSLVLEVGGLPRTVAAGGPLTFVVSLGADSEQTLVRPAAGPRLVVTRGGVVVATTDVYGGARADRVAQAGWVGVAQHVGDVGLAVCGTAPGTSAGAPLPAGAYEIWFVGEGTLTDADLSDVDAGATGLHRSVVHGPEPLTIEGSADVAWRPPTYALDAGRPDLPGAGAVAPAAPTTTGPWRFTHSSGPLELSAADLVAQDGVSEPLAGPGIEVDGTLTYVGPGRTNLHADVVVAHWLVQDGQVVATTYVPTDAYSAVMDLGPGHGATLHSPAEPLARCGPSSGTQTLCTSEGDPVPPGEYTLLPGVVVHGGELWTPEGGVQRLADLLGARGPYVVLGAPVPLTLR